MTEPNDEPAATQAIDPSRLANLREIDPGLVAEIAQLWLDTTPPILKQLVDAAASSDLAAVSRLAHSLRGSSGNLGADALAEACGALEVGSRPEAAAPASAPELVAEVVAQHARAAAELELLAGKPGSGGAST